MLDLDYTLDAAIQTQLLQIMQSDIIEMLEPVLLHFVTVHVM